MKKLNIFFGLFLAIISSSCTSGGGHSSDSIIVSHSHASPLDTNRLNLSKSSQNINTKTNYNIYIENSISMDGYVHGVTDFEQSIFNLISDIKISKKTGDLNLYYINSDTFNIFRNAELTLVKDFIDKLEPTNFVKKGGKRGETELYNIVKTATGNVNENNVTVIISDFIFSPGKGVKADQYLVNQQIGFKTLFNDKIESQNISTMMLKFHSKFQGKYFDKEDNGIDFSSSPIERPFYVMVVGPDEPIRDVISLIDTIKYKQRGFEKLVYLGKSAAAEKKSSPAEITYRKKKGEFEIDPPASMRIIAAKQEGDQSTGSFQFAVKVDFSRLVCDPDYLLDPKNYEIFPGNYSVKPEIISPGNDASQKGYTHLLVVSTNELKNSSDSISIKLKNSLPEWIEESSNPDDAGVRTDIRLQKTTFGFINLMTGIKDAYEKDADNKYLFRTNVSVTRAAAGTSAMIWFVFVLILLGVGYFILKKIKSA